MIANPRDIPALVKALRGTPFTVLPGVNTLFNALLNNTDFATLDFSRLHLAIAGGMAVQRTVAERWQPVTGKPLIEAYGLTETSPAAIANPLTSITSPARSACPCPRPRSPFATTTAAILRSAKPANCASGARK